MKDSLHRVEVTVSLWIAEDADVNDVVSEMDYTFDHPAVVMTELIDINTEVS